MDGGLRGAKKSRDEGWRSNFCCKRTVHVLNDISRKFQRELLVTDHG